MNNKTILNALPLPVYWIEERKKTFKGCNQYFLDLFKIGSLSDIVDKPIKKIFMGEYLRIISNLIETSKKNKEKVFSAIYHKTIDGNEKPICIQSVSLLSEKNVVVFSEIYPELKDFNQFLWKEKEKLSIYLNNIIENIPASIYWKDRSSVILGGSKLHAELAGYSGTNEGVVGKTDYDFIWKYQAERIQENDRFVIENDRMLTFEETAKLSDGKMHVFLTQKSALKGKLGENIGVLGVSIDISELKKTQKKLNKAKLVAEVANQAKMEFIANMSHDIRTPLMGIIGLSELLERRLTVTENKEDIKLLRESSERLLQLLNSVLDIAALEKIDETKIKYESFSLVDLLNSLKDLLTPSAKIKGLEFNVDIDIPEYKNVICDRLKLERILLNLSTNAVKFTKKGKIRLVVKELLPKLENGMHAAFTISDTGVGIPYEKISYIFDHFFRVKPTYEEVNRGYGVGLYIAKKFVNLLGGVIKVESKVGVGTTFSFSLFMQFDSIVKSKKNISKKTFNFSKVLEKKLLDFPITDEADVEVTLNKANILLVEDDLVATKFSKKLLSDAGYNVKIATTSEAALNFAKKHVFDLIILDFELPKIGGNELAVLYRYWENVNDKPRIPIIALTAHGGETFQRQCFVAGINKVWLKPLSSQKIKELTEILKKQKNLALIAKPKESEIEEVEKEEMLVDSSIEVTNLLELIYSYPLFDKGVSLTSLNGNEKLFKELVELFKESLPGQIEELEAAYKIKNWETIENLIHKLKGGACYVGAVRLNYICQDFLRCYAKGQAQLFNRLYEELLLILLETQKILTYSPKIESN